MTNRFFPLSTGAFRRSLAMLACAATLLQVSRTSAQELVYSQDFESDSTAEWVVNSGSGTNTADFFFDYSTVGVPPAPSSAGGSTRALKLQANMDPATQAGSVSGYGLSVSPLNFGITDNFDMRFDLWLNYPKSGNGSTQIGGAGYGTAGTAAQIAGRADSIFIGASTDGGSGVDYRVYGPAFSTGYTEQNKIDPNDPASPSVFAAGGRNNTAAYYSTNFPGGIPVPQAQTNLIPTQTGLSNVVGTLGLQWREVSLRKVGNLITYRVDGVLIASIDARHSGPLGGQNILFNLYDINGNASTDPSSTNTLFALFDNVRITNFPSIVTVNASQPNASEEGPTPGSFTIERTSAGVAATVNYLIGGTATPGIDYAPLSGTATFGPFDTTVEVTVTPINDSVSEYPETVEITIVDGEGYVGSGSATVTIADNDTPTLNVSVVQPTMYEPYANDFIRYRIERYGNLDAADFTVNLAFSGTATAGTDFVLPEPVTMPAGASTVDFLISPLDNPAATGSKTVVATLASGSGYAIGTNSPSATGMILDDETTQTSVLYSSPLSAAGDASNWTVLYGTGDPTNNAANFSADFGYDLAAASLPPAPGGATTALRLSANKLLPAGSGASGAVNAYYKNLAFGGDYAVRFDLYLVENSVLNTATEGVLFGINHSGSQSNWWHGSGPLAQGATWGSDGVWFYITAQPGGTATGDYMLYTGQGGTNGNTGWTRVATKFATAFTNAFKAHPDMSRPGPFTSYGSANPAPGVPANVDPALIPGGSWADVEIKQVANVVTLSVNKIEIFSYTNTTVWTNGHLMLGYSDPFASSTDGSVAAAYFANLSVVRLAAPEVTATVLAPTTVTLTFTTTDTTSPFVVEGAATVDGAFTNVNATITYLGNGTYQAVAPRSGDMQFFRVRRL
jgi:hypothetical protein